MVGSKNQVPFGIEQIIKEWWQEKLSIDTIITSACELDKEMQKKITSAEMMSDKRR